MTESRPYQCFKCDKCFKKKAHLEFHQYVHSDNYPFKCKDCDRCFKNIPSVKKHIKKGIFICSYCNEHFNIKCSFKKHLKECKPKILTKCDFCDFKCEKKDMQEHMKIHGEKNYVCNICDCSFELKKSLYSHKKLHSNTVLQCKYCFFSDKRIGVFNCHVKTHKMNECKDCDYKNLSLLDFLHHRLSTHI
jgi:KRAB domain-containing zinc finger protein